VSPTVVAVGNFDGVHRGHQAILRAARDAAGPLPVIAVSFWPHPMTVLPGQTPPLLLTELPDRIRLLKEAGADQVRVVQFTAQMAGWPPRQFVDTVLRPLQPRAVVVGENFRFGRGAAADGHTMAELSDGAFQVMVLPMLCDEAPLSSSRVRRALVDGDPARAAWMLGRWFRFSGIVVQGDQRGRQLGFPTANLTVPAGHALPQDGVYAGWLTAPAELAPKTQPASPLRRSLAAPAARSRPGGPVTRGPAPVLRDGAILWPAAISVGSNPTFEGVERRVEAHAIDQTDLDLYGHRVGIDFTDRIRSMRRFASLDALTGQLGQDVAAARAILARTGDMWRPGTPAPATALADVAG
jgi:riboflavin kinase/FMN adenylyltransferase